MNNPKDWYAIERTFTLYDGSKIKWTRSRLEEESCLIGWFDAWCLFANANEVNLEFVRHNHDVKFLYHKED